MRFGVFSMAMLLAGGASGNTARSHPYLFTTRADIDRARTGAERDPEFARLLEALVDRAKSADPETLPLLETDWCEEARAKPWSDTYPEVFHHTLAVPARWAAMAQECAHACVLGGDDALGEKAARVLLGLSEYTFEFEHYDVGMFYTVWGFRALDAYDCLFDRLDPSDRGKLDAFFERMLRAVIVNDEYWIDHEPGGPMNNHYAWHKLGRCMIGLFYDRPEQVEAALNGPKGVVEMFRHGFRDDGLWLEGSIPYQFAATSAFLIMAEILETAAYPVSLWSEDVAGGRNLRQSYDAMFPLLFPDRTLPPIGDSYAKRPHLGGNTAYETLYRRFGDPRYAWLVRDAPRRSPAALLAGVPEVPAGEVPAQTSRLWPEQGYAALRSVEGTDYWSGRGITVFATYSNAPVHVNADKLSIMLFADEHLWLPDCEAKTGAEHAFSADIQRELNRETICHNTLLVDGASQRHPDRRLDLLEYSVLPLEKRVTIGDLDGRLYAGVRQLRTLIVRNDYVLDVFQAESEESHEYAWLIHVDGEPQSGSLEPVGDWDLPAEPPWRYLRSAEVCRPAAAAWEVFERNGQMFRYDLQAAADTEPVLCGFPRDDSRDPDTLPMRMFRSSAKTFRVCAVYRTAAGPADPAQVSAREGPLGSWYVDVRIGETITTHRVPRLAALR